MEDEEVPERARSTKEIARAAVEDEFRQRKSRKRGRGGGGGSSSSDDEDSDQDEVSDNKEENRNLKTQKRTRVSDKNLPESDQGRYRDRAKERREGKNDDYEVTMALLKGVEGGEDGADSAEKVRLSKYLGGDEAHTHLVKGLDIRLAQKVRREMGMNLDSERDVDDLDVVLQQARREQLPLSRSETKLVNNLHEATQLLNSLSPESLLSEIGRDVLRYLRRKYLPLNHSERHLSTTSAAGLAIQQATLTFASNGHPHDIPRSWEVPRENIHAAHFGTGDGKSLAATPLDNTMLEKMKSALDERHSLNQNHDRDDGKKSVKKSSPKHGADENDTNQESDDDIFDDLGDYVPASVSNKKTTAAENTTKGSIFKGLVTTNKDTADLQPGIDTLNEGSRRTKDSAVTHRKDVIDRDVLGTRSLKDGSRPKMLAGVSLSSYSGGYGEEMDVDFDGRLGEEEAKSKKDSKKDRGKEKATEP